jgi:hypothetical protein
MTEKHFISIWFFIGAILTIYGVLITGASIYNLFVPPPQTVVLEHLHAGIWWGLLLLVMGLFYAIKFFPKKS